MHAVNTLVQRVIVGPFDAQILHPAQSFVSTPTERTIFLLVHGSDHRHQFSPS